MTAQGLRRRQGLRRQQGLRLQGARAREQEQVPGQGQGTELPQKHHHSPLKRKPMTPEKQLHLSYSLKNEGSLRWQKRERLWETQEHQ